MKSRRWLQLQHNSRLNTVREACDRILEGCSLERSAVAIRQRLFNGYARRPRLKRAVTPPPESPQSRSAAAVCLVRRRDIARALAESKG